MNIKVIAQGVSVSSMAAVVVLLIATQGQGVHGQQIAERTERRFELGNYDYHLSARTTKNGVLHDVIMYARQKKGTPHAESSKVYKSAFPAVWLAKTAYHNPKPDAPNQWVLKDGVRHLYGEDATHLEGKRFIEAGFRFNREVQAE